MTALTEWQNFYTIVGSSAGALIGLQFVVLALIANTPRTQDLAQAGAAYSTPTIVHFSAVLFLAAFMCAPWHDIASLSALWAVAGFAGLLYNALVTFRLRRQTVYKPVFEDWLFHAILPLLAYAALGASALALLFQPRPAFICVAAAALLLLLSGIHNAWDSVTYHVLVKPPGQTSE